MRLEDYPRPKVDTGIGFRYFGDLSHYGREALMEWLAELKDMGTSWLVLTSDLSSTVPELFVRELVAHEVEPVIRIVVRPIRPVDANVLLRTFQQYADWGVHYVYVFSEPNLASEWLPSDWIVPKLVERFSGLLVPCLEAMSAAGLCPLLPPLTPGGHYWDTTFLGQMLDFLAVDSRRYLLDRAAVAMNNYASNRPLSWGRGGSERWPSARPYVCPNGSQDHRGFHLFEWYDQVIRSRLGHSLPLIAVENGLIVGTQNHPDFPRIDEMTHSMRSIEMVRVLMDGEAPPYVFNHAFWALAASDDEQFEGHAWYKRDGSQLPAVRALKLLKKHPRTIDAPEPVPIEAQPLRPIYHYLLFHLPLGPSDSESWTPQTLLAAALSYVSKFQPTVGFNVEEARRASRVTLVSSEAQSAATIASALSADGCLVELIEATTDKEVKRILDEQTRRGQRFRQLVE